MRRLFPAHPKHVADAKVGDLHMTMSVQQEVLRFDVAMRNAHRMEVSDAVDDLLEATFDFCLTHPTAFDGRIQVAAGTVFHHFAPMPIFILHQIHRLDDVDVMKC